MSLPRHLLAISLPLTAMLALSSHAEAHRRWILPLSTVHSSENAWVSFDAAVSNDIFHADYVAMRPDDIVALGPQGKAVPLENIHTGKYRSTFDLPLNEQGTYKIHTVSHGLSASWLNEAGERRRWPGRGERFTEEGFRTQVPAEAKDLEVIQTSSRMETFVTSGEPSDTVFSPEGKGLELVPVTHPNDLFAGESAIFRFLIDGEPAAGVQVTVLAGGIRYRDSQNEIEATGNAGGEVEIHWPDAGMYWLEASYEDSRGKAPATARRGSYVATFEVLPL